MLAAYSGNVERLHVRRSANNATDNKLVHKCFMCITHSFFSVHHTPQPNQQKNISYNIYMLMVVKCYTNRSAFHHAAPTELVIRLVSKRCKRCEIRANGKEIYAHVKTVNKYET